METQTIQTAKEHLVAANKVNSLIAQEYAVKQVEALAFIAIAEQLSRFNDWLYDQSKFGGVLNK
jgi:hypothetical protein